MNSFGLWLAKRWYRRRSVVSTLFAPLAWVFRVLVWLRQVAFRRGWLESRRLPVPVVVVGNITVGGSGKTPLVIWLVEWLRQHGYQPGVVAGNYRGDDEHPTLVRRGASTAGVGDEAVLLAERLDAPVMAGPNRTETATELLLAYPKLDVLVLDDGLQHYGLQRDLELVVFDRRGLGNGRFLPVGPLREGPARLRGVNAIVWNGGQVDRRAAAMTPAFNMHIAIDRVWNLADPSRSVAADHFRGQRINAVAGIGEPERFFDALTAAGLLFDAHPFPDHHRYTPEHFLFRREAPVLMTEKDAVKCRRFAAPNWWACRVSAQVDPGLGKLVLEKLRSGSAPS